MWTDRMSTESPPLMRSEQQCLKRQNGQQIYLQIYLKILVMINLAIKYYNLDFYKISHTLVYNLKI